MDDFIEVISFFVMFPILVGTALYIGVIVEHIFNLENIKHSGLIQYLRPFILGSLVIIAICFITYLFILVFIL